MKPAGFDLQKPNSIVDDIIEALQTDGAHHKQWFLEMILFKLVGEEEFTNMNVQSSGWEKGIVP